MFHFTTSFCLWFSAAYLMVSWTKSVPSLNAGVKRADILRTFVKGSAESMWPGGALSALAGLLGPCLLWHSWAFMTHSASKADLCSGWAKGEWIGQSKWSDGFSPGEIVLLFTSGLQTKAMFQCAPSLPCSVHHDCEEQHSGSKRRRAGRAVVRVTVSRSGQCTLETPPSLWLAQEPR